MNVRIVESLILPAQGLPGAAEVSSGPQSAFSNLALSLSARLWFIVAVAGQWLFAAYIVSYYGRAALGHVPKWDHRLTHGLVPGDAVGNTALVSHLALAALITAAGPLQLVPQIRARLPLFHRWNGRVYLLAAFLGGISGLYMVWIRNGTPPGALIQHLGISLDAALMMVFAVLALRFALARRFDVHRRWAIRLFLVMSGQWFFRVGVFFSLVVNRGPFGFDPDSFQGPFLDFLASADTLLPLALFEFYLLAQRRPGAAGRIAMAAVLIAASAVTAVGVAGIAMILWLPKI